MFREKRSAPEARKSVAPAEGRGFQICREPQPRRGVRLCESILRPSGPRACSRVVTPALRPGLYSYGPPGLFVHTLSNARRLITFGFLLCVTLFFNVAVPQIQAQSLGLTPAEVQYAFKPGQPFQFEIAISNSGSNAQAMRASITDLWYNEKNEKLFNPAGSSPRSAANWMEVVPPQITVPAGGTGKVKVVVT